MLGAAFERVGEEIDGLIGGVLRQRAQPSPEVVVAVVSILQQAGRGEQIGRRQGAPGNLERKRGARRVSVGGIGNLEGQQVGARRQILQWDRLAYQQRAEAVETLAIK